MSCLHLCVPLPSLFPPYAGITPFLPRSSGTTAQTRDLAGYLKAAKDSQSHVTADPVQFTAMSSLFPPAPIVPVDAHLYEDPSRTPSSD